MATHSTTRSIWDPQIVRRAIWDSFGKLHPRTMAQQPGHVRRRDRQRADDAGA